MYEPPQNFSVQSPYMQPPQGYSVQSPYQEPLKEKDSFRSVSSMDNYDKKPYQEPAKTPTQAPTQTSSTEPKMNVDHQTGWTTLSTKPQKKTPTATSQTSYFNFATGDTPREEDEERHEES